MNIKEGIRKVVNKENLTENEMADIMNEIMSKRWIFNRSKRKRRNF